MKYPPLLCITTCLIMACLICGFSAEDWGFFAHKRINRLAVFTLPSDLIDFYKPHIEYVTDHAVDADKRRYATKHEGVRHYIDIDQWGTYPFEHVPRNFSAAFARFAELMVVSTGGDTTLAYWTDYHHQDHPTAIDEVLDVSERGWDSLVREHAIPLRYEMDVIPVEALAALDPMYEQGHRYFVVNKFSEHGILPYNLMTQQRKLTDAFRRKDLTAILRYSSDLGHYIGDAHVPLHTTTNYNGQLTDQIGIHAFWESRIPELYADASYDYFVGKAEYIEDVRDFYWDIVLTSHSLVDSVLLIEKRLSKTYPEDEQYCFVDRNNLPIRTQCEPYAGAYQDAMGGMVEDRFRASVLAVGSAWYTAWVDAGKPNLTDKEVPVLNLDTTFSQPSSEGVPSARAHWE